ncbi:hypothetical protein NLJ89_g12042 [Agrocybe chaxingu]|uniref:Uncharacterized protein n=1 Tax=Agrocybe chaxingu TaxID=84603 RepID=A0A9W8MPG2_9AGAR|nr:hypothetical protein NLJ89_g12042 [Agrocybe chaxingu]
MLLLAGLLWRVLAFGTLVLPAAALRFNFTDVQQCDQVMISFAGSNLRNNSVPSSLSILPVNSTAILVPLPDPGIINTGVALTFLPFAAGTNFVASLDDSAGENLIFVSDLIRVLPSASGNSSCLSNPSPNQQKLFALTSPVSQCENITVTYNTTLTTKPPIVRLYNPKGRSFRLNQTSDDRASGTATYLMNFFRGREIILLMDDGDGVRETTPLLSVGGDSASDTSCIQRNFTFGFPPNNTGANDSNTTPVASKAVIIGGATGGGAVLLIARHIAGGKRLRNK